MSFVRFLAVLVVSLVVFLALGWFWYLNNLKPIDPKTQAVVPIIIKKGSNGIEIAHVLKQNGLIRSQKSFLLYLKLNPATLQAGTFKLSKNMSVPEIIDQLANGKLDVWVTIPEGLRREEVAAKLSRQLPLLKADEFINLTKDKEGYLFPDTYLFPKEAAASLVIKTMLATFERKARPSLIKAARKHDLSQSQALILASLVEREAKFDKGRRIVASILLKRLKNDWPLQVDATLQYVEGTKAKWWPVLTKIDKQLDSKFNTYKYTGLPPRPIANPGVEVINAVVKADDKIPYWFYVSDKKGVIHPAKTIKEHNQNIEKYLRRS